MTYNQKIINSMVFYLNIKFIGTTKVDAILALYKIWNIEEDCKRIPKAVKKYFNTNI